MLAMMTMMMIMIKQKFRKEILVHVSNRKFVVAWSTYTTYIKYFLLFSRNLHGRFSFGTQLCFNGLLEINESNHFCWGGGGGVVLYSG